MNEGTSGWDLETSASDKEWTHGFWAAIVNAFMN